MKKLLLIVPISCFNLYAPPKKIFRLSNSQQSTNKSSSEKTDQALVFIDPSQIYSSTNFQRDEENEEHLTITTSSSTKYNNSKNLEEASLTAPHSSPTKNNNDDDDFDDLNDETPNPRKKIDQSGQNWMTILYEKYYKVANEQFLYQRFCQLIGARKKYTVLEELLHKGQLTNYIDELNARSISTGNSLLNEALCQAIQDNQNDTVIKLLSETSKYTNGLSAETKQKLDAFLEEDNKTKQNDISKKVSDYLERIRLTILIRHTFAGTDYNGPNFLTMAAATSVHIKDLTKGVITNNLPSLDNEKIS